MARKPRSTPRPHGGPAADTDQFSLDSKDYEIDLFTTNAEKLREALHPFAEAGRKTPVVSAPAAVGPAPRAVILTPRKSGPGRKENGYEVSNRGRIHQTAKDTYYAAH